MSKIRPRHLLMPFVILVVVPITSSVLSAQDTKQRPRIQLDYYHINDSLRQLTATVKAKQDRSYVNVPGVPVKLHIQSDNETRKLLSEVVSGDDGRSVFEIPEQEVAGMTLVTLIASIEESEQFENYERDIEIVPSRFNVDLSIVDSVKTIRVTLEAMDSSGVMVPVKGVDILVYAKRLFGELPISTEFNTTSAAGVSSIVFPEDVPGNAEGRIEVVTKVMDHPSFGNLTNTTAVNWGVPVEPGQVNKRELWAARANAPIYLVVIVNTILLVIWGTILYIVRNLFKIKRLGRETNS